MSNEEEWYNPPCNKAPECPKTEFCRGCKFYFLSLNEEQINALNSEEYSKWLRVHGNKIEGRSLGEVVIGIFDNAEKVAKRVKA